MAGGLVGELFVRLRADNSNLKQQLNEVNTALNNIKGAAKTANGEMSNSFKDLTGNLLASAAVMHGAQKAFNFVKDAVVDAYDKTMDYSFQIRDMNNLIGTSSEEASRFINIASDLNISYRELQTSLVNAIKKGYEPSIDGLKKMADEYQNLPSQIERAKFALDTFGKSGENMIPILKLGSAGIENYLGNIDQSVILTDKQVQQNLKLAKSIGDINNQMSGFKYQAMSATAPLAKEYLDELKGGDFATTLANIISQPAKGFPLLQKAMLDMMTAKDASDNLKHSIGALVSVGGENAKWAGVQGEAWFRYAESQALAISLTVELGKVFEKYNADLEKAGTNTEKINDVTNEAKKSLKDYAFEALTAGMNLDQYGDFVYKAALHFGQMTEAEFEAARTARELQKYIMDNNLTFEQAQPLISQYNAGLGQLMAGGRADYFIYIHYITSGGFGPQANPAMQLPKGFGQGQTSAIMGKHGGTFIGLQHGGVVPPGFANDGYPIFVSSGERVDVTPAGNKNIEGSGESSITIKNYGPVHYHWPKDEKGKDFLAQITR